ncbi:Leucine-rich repeat, immunoglobulin-like domain and transmembrane domain-containing protein 3 [Plecturocebus cupreus]
MYPLEGSRSYCLDSSPMEVSVLPPQVGGRCFPKVESQIDQGLFVAPEIFVDQLVNGLLIGTKRVMLQSLRESHSDVPPLPSLLPPVQNNQIQRNFSGLTGTEAHVTESMCYHLNFDTNSVPGVAREAEGSLANVPDGSFLVRGSSDDRYLLSLSFCSHDKTLHTRIECSNGRFSFYEQPDVEGHTSIVDLIEHSVRDSENGPFCYSRSWLPGSATYPVRVTNPVSPFMQARSLKYLCYFVTHQYTRIDDNPWFCDCHISKMIELSKVVDPAIVFLDPLMICSEPERLTGILFQRAELERCLKPSVMTSATKIMSALGSNVLLRCDATGFPTPQLTWTRSDSLPVNYTVIQESPEEGVRWSIMSLTGISAKDAGDYKCKAKNLAGMSEAVVTVTVLGVITTTVSPATSERTGDHPEWEVQPGSGRSTSVSSASPYPWSSSFPATSSLSASTLSPPSISSFSLSPSFSSTAFSTVTLSTSISASTTMANKRSLQLHPDGRRNLKVAKSESKLPPASTSNEEELALLDQTMLIETNATIENLRVVSKTKESVTLTWNMINTTHNSAVTVLYSKYGGKDLLLLNADSSKNQVIIDGLEPGGQYMACVCPKGVPPQKDQCITFSTERVEGDDSQWSLLLVVTSTACVLVLPLICFLLYKVCKLQCKSEPFWEDDLAEETYIQFETLFPRSQSMGELWTRRHRDDSEKLLLCSRSSVESQVVVVIFLTLEQAEVSGDLLFQPRLDVHEPLVSLILPLTVSSHVA